MLYLSLGDYAKAEPILLEALAIAKQAFGTKHPQTLRMLHDLGILYQELGDEKRAELYLLQSLELEQTAPAELLRRRLCLADAMP